MRRRFHRPPWWPEDEPWPPQRPPWQVNRRRFLFAIAFIAVVAIIVVSVIAVVGYHFIEEARRGDNEGPPAWIIFPILFWSMVIYFVVKFIRRLGKSVEPVFELIGASARVSAGDYSVRVTPARQRDIGQLVNAFNSMTERLEVNDQQRRRLLADIAHELRTPLAVIQGNVEGMIDGIYPRDDAHLEPLLHESRLIARLLDDLQTLSRAEAGVLPLYHEPVLLADLLRDTVRAFQPRAGDAGVELAFVEHDAVPESEVDPMRIRQVIENLLANALRHTPAGGSVRVTLNREGDTARVTVADTGEGIPPDLVPLIFDRFVKSADSGGSGLGLAIARRLVEAHHGTISAASTVGTGTTITVHIPVANAAPS